MTVSFREKNKRPLQSGPLFFCFLLVSLRLSLALGQEATVQSSSPLLVDLSVELIEQKFGAGWKGILFICDPYCRALSVREEKVWVPSLPTLKIKETHIRAVAKSDPLYPLLVGELGNSLSTTVKDSKDGDKDSSAIAENIPPYTQTVFDYGYAFNIGSATSSYLTTSNTQIQSDLKNQITPTSIPIRFSFMKGKPVKFFDTFWQLQLHYLTENATAASGGSTSHQLTAAQDAFHLQGLVMRNGYRVALGLTQLNQKMTSSSDSLTLYSYQTSRMIVNLGLLWKRFLFNYDYSLSANISENQNFRTSPIQESWNAFRVSYYSENFSAFDFEFGLYGLAESTSGKQDSNVNSTIFSAQTSSLQTSSTRFEFGIRFGEDLFQ